MEIFIDLWVFNIFFIIALVLSILYWSTGFITPSFNTEDNPVQNFYFIFAILGCLSDILLLAIVIIQLLNINSNLEENNAKILVFIFILGGIFLRSLLLFGKYLYRSAR